MDNFEKAVMILSDLLSDVRSESAFAFESFVRAHASGQVRSAELRIVFDEPKGKLEVGARVGKTAL